MRRIVFVSRLDFDCSLGALTLCEIAPNLAQKYPDLQIIIMGGGRMLPEIQKKSRKINANINHRLIFATGQSDNPSEYFIDASLFVGVSRSALEAMAYGLPVILLGNEGYLGLLDENNLSFAKKTNFTCRGAGNISDTNALRMILYSEICRYFELSDNEKARLSRLSLDVIKNGYSSLDMAHKTLEIYKKVLLEKKKTKNTVQNKKCKVAICGYYGHQNLGDEVILSVVSKKLQEVAPNAEIHIIGGKNPIKILRDLWGAKLFIFGGGSLLQNSTSNVSLFYYLALIRFAHALCERTVMLSNGIGPFENRVFAREIFIKSVMNTIEKLDFISVRDSQSQKLLQKHLPQKNIALIPDPALLCSHQPKIKTETNTQMSSFAYIPCHRGLKKENISLKELSESLKKVQNSYNIDLIIVVMNPREDMEISKKLVSKLPNTRILCPKSPKELLSVFSETRFVISQRYHGTLFSAISGAPVLAISNDTKMNAFCVDYGLYDCQRVSILSSGNEICNKISQVEAQHVKSIDFIQENIKRKKKISNENLKKYLKNFTTPIDKSEHLFYN